MLPRLPRSFYARDSRVVAPELLHKVIVHGQRSARIVEVEAYAGAADPGSHAFRGRTRRNAVMFGPPGLLYVYFTYGMHWCANVVCGEEGTASAVLLRAGAPVAGIEQMWEARPRAHHEEDLCRGPARLCQALGITGTHNGVDLVADAMDGSDMRVTIVGDGVVPPPKPGVSVRVGLSAGADLPWRWFVPGNRHVSGRRRHQP